MAEGGDRVLVVLNEEQYGCVVGAGEDECFAGVSFGHGTVTDVSDHGFSAFGLPSGSLVETDAHRVPGGVESLGGEHDGVEPEPGLFGVPAAEGVAAEHGEDVDEVDAARECDAMFPVGREDRIEGAQCVCGSGLRGFLTVGGDPQCELTLSLERSGCVVEPTGERHLPVEQ